MRTLVICAVVVALVSGCASELSRWEAARRLDTVRGYEEFVRENSGTAYVDQAEDRIEELRFGQAKYALTADDAARANALVEKINSCLARRPDKLMIPAATATVDASRGILTISYEKLMWRIPLWAINTDKSTCVANGFAWSGSSEYDASSKTGVKTTYDFEVNNLCVLIRSAFSMDYFHLRIKGADAWSKETIIAFGTDAHNDLRIKVPDTWLNEAMIAVATKADGDCVVQAVTDLKKIFQR